ncbi:MAG: hypothetical protein D6679_01565 [Candidatus Hydrogenedentota bacterium]|nr:MAG: hypothetical protein D6679_01565 [Candidatus Hydrogenedentota bacterium]
MAETRKEEGGETNTSVGTGVNRWHRTGILLSLIGLIAIIMALVVVTRYSDPLWYVTTRHSDRPQQVLEALDELDKQITKLEEKRAFLLEEVRKTRKRAEWKAGQSAKGIGEPGETIDEKKRRELKEVLAPQWRKVAEHAGEIAARHSK